MRSSPITRWPIAWATQRLPASVCGNNFSGYSKQQWKLFPDVRSGDEQFITIVEVIDDKTIQVKEDLSDWLGSFDETGNLVVDTTTSTLTPEEYEALDPDEQNGYAKTDDVYKKTTTSYPGDNLYIRGERVNDFRTLKKEMLFAINFSATQALDKQLQAEKAKFRGKIIST